MNPSWTFTTAVTHGQNWEGIYLNKQEPKQIVFFLDKNVKKVGLL